MGQLDNSGFSIRIYTYDLEFSVADLISIRWVETVVAAELLSYFLFLIHPMGMCAWRDLYRLGFAHKRAGQFADHQT